MSAATLAVLVMLIVVAGLGIVAVFSYRAEQAERRRVARIKHDAYASLDSEPELAQQLIRRCLKYEKGHGTDKVFVDLEATAFRARAATPESLLADVVLGELRTRQAKALNAGRSNR